MPTKTRLLQGVVLLTAIGASSAVTWWIARPPGEGPDCAAASDPHERDLCQYTRLEAAPPTDPEGVGPVVATITDPILRSAAVLTWVSVHPTADPQRAVRLCDLLDTTEQFACQRRLNSPHLRRTVPVAP